jgi:hypothetical protein
VDAGGEIDAADGCLGCLRLGAGYGERRCAVMLSLKNERSFAKTLPMRTAAEQWAAQGVDYYFVSFREPFYKICYVVGKGGECYMLHEEWLAYLELCKAPTISMRQVDAEEERQWDSQTMRQGEATPAADDLQRIYGALETALGEVSEMLQQAEDRLRLCMGTVRSLRQADKLAPSCDDCGKPAACSGYHEVAGYIHYCVACSAREVVSGVLTQIRPLSQNGGAA